MKELKNCKLTIGRVSCINRSLHNKIVIEVEDENYNKIVEIELSAENLGLALTGLAYRDCEVKM